MYINYFGNVMCDCVVLSNPQFKESVGEYKTDLTVCTAKSKEYTPEGLQSVNLRLCFFGAFAVPAMKASRGMCLMVAGRESVQEVYAKGRDVLERTIYVDWWSARDIDPLGSLEELKVRVEKKTREQEFKESFWNWLNTEPVKTLIINWFISWLREQKGNTAKPEDERNLPNN